MGTHVCFLALALRSPRGCHFISRLIGFRNVVHRVLALCWGQGQTYELDRHTPVTASIGCSQGSQHKNIKSPNTNFEPTEKLTNSNKTWIWDLLGIFWQYGCDLNAHIKFPTFVLQKPLKSLVFPLILSPKDGLSFSHICDAVFSILKGN